jgi:hypothetical protein
MYGFQTTSLFIGRCKGPPRSEVALAPAVSDNVALHRPLQHELMGRVTHRFRQRRSSSAVAISVSDNVALHRPLQLLALQVKVSLGLKLRVPRTLAPDRMESSSIF